MQIFDSKEKVIKIFTFQQFCIPLLTLVHLMDQISYPPPVRPSAFLQSEFVHADRDRGFFG